MSVARFALGLFTLACSSTTSDDPFPESGTEGDAIACVASCSECLPGETCLTTGSFTHAAIIPACVRSCTSSADCASGLKCLALNAPNGAAYCVSETLPAECEPLEVYAHCDFFMSAFCKDATTLASPEPRFGVLCGFELTHCAAGCEAAAGDGSTAAACK